MALAWCLRDPRVTSVLIGASSVAQLEDNVAALDHLDFSADELAAIDQHAVEGGINLWQRSSELTLRRRAQLAGNAAMPKASEARS